MTTINGNVSSGPPERGPFAWDWVETTETTSTTVTVWRGIPGDPRRELIMTLSGGYLYEIADYLDALAYTIREQAGILQAE